MSVEATIGTPVRAAARAVARSPWPSGSHDPDHADGGEHQRAWAAACRTAPPTDRARRRPTSIRGIRPQRSNAVDVGPLGALVAGAARDVGPQLLRSWPPRPAAPGRRRTSGARAAARQPVEVDRRTASHRGSACGIPWGELGRSCRGRRAGGRQRRSARPRFAAPACRSRRGCVTPSRGRPVWGRRRPPGPRAVPLPHPYRLRRPGWACPGRQVLCARFFRYSAMACSIG